MIRKQLHDTFLETVTTCSKNRTACRTSHDLFATISRSTLDLIFAGQAFDLSQFPRCSNSSFATELIRDRLHPMRCKKSYAPLKCLRFNTNTSQTVANWIARARAVMVQ